MNSKTDIAKTGLEIVANRRVQAFAIGVLVLSVLAVLQVNNLKRHAPMCELLANANLGNADVQRMQIALSQSGLSEYEIQDNRLMVPLAKHSEYLQAIAEKDAIPEELRQSDTNAQTPISPFLSRFQQQALERREKKKQICDMVLRLPFVEQAWLEMDKSTSHSAFEQAEQKAVISIRTRNTISLSDQHVDTVKRMIGGAVTGLGSENIVVIDLDAGLAHQHMLDAPTEQQARFQRITIEQQQSYENRIREILKGYPGINVSVHVEVEPTPQEDYVASIPSSVPTETQPHRISPLPVAGANGYATIGQPLEPISSVESKAIGLSSHTTNVPEHVERVSVSIDVPQKLVHDLFGPPPSSSFGTSQSDLQAKMASDIDEKFERLRLEIIQKVQPILAQSNVQNAAETPISVSLIRDPLPESPQWLAQAQGFAIQNWPSAAVLFIGLMLLSIVTRKSVALDQTADAPRNNDNGDTLSIHSHTPDASDSIENPEIRLTKLIEKDPDAAARVIEAWIRDAA